MPGTYAGTNCLTQWLADVYEQLAACPTIWTFLGVLDATGAKERIHIFALPKGIILNDETFGDQAWTDLHPLVLISPDEKSGFVKRNRIATGPVWDLSIDARLHFQAIIDSGDTNTEGDQDWNFVDTVGAVMQEFGDRNSDESAAVVHEISEASQFTRLLPKDEQDMHHLQNWQFRIAYRENSG